MRLSKAEALVEHTANYWKQFVQETDTQIRAQALRDQDELRQQHALELKRCQDTASTVVARLARITLRNSNAVVQGWPRPRHGYTLSLAFEADVFAHEKDQSEREFLADVVAQQVRQHIVASRFIEALDSPDDRPVPVRPRRRP